MRRFESAWPLKLSVYWFMMTIEQKVARAILEEPVGELEIEGKVYPIAPPSTGTLILVSEIISTLPVVEKVTGEKVASSVLHFAKDYKALGDIVAVLILGRKHLVEEVEEKVIEKPRFFGLLGARRERIVRKTINRRAELANAILDNVRPSVLMDVVIRRLKDMEIGDFFAITTSLSEANILAPTKEVD